MSDTSVPAAPPKTTITVLVDGQEMEADKGELVIDAAERVGVHIPRFCYHNRMQPVGMCRMCLVEIDAGRGPALQPSCMIPVSEGMKVDTTSERTRKAQDGVLEFLLINHPLDCPVCDKGGECPLQDITVAFGPGESRFVEEKRHFEKPIEISENVLLDRERCILCDRCTRFAKEVAGDPLIHFMGRGSHTEINTFPGEPFSSYFSGNVVQICPVGALTAKPYRFRARPWDLDETPSTCTTCSVGCSITVQSSRDEVLRYQGVDNDATNWGWLCDRGRFNFQSVNSPDRLLQPVMRPDRFTALAPARWSDALRRAADAIKRAIAERGPGSIAVLGGARLTNESQYAWAKLAKAVIGTDNVDAQLGDGLDPRLLFGLPRATIAEACAAKGTIILLGPDPKESLGVLYLRLRHAIVQDGATLVEVTHAATGLSHLAAASLRCKPGGELLDMVQSLLPGGSEADLIGPGPITVLLGRTSLSEDPALISAAALMLLKGIPGVRFLPLLPRGNVFGALDAGLAPGLLPGQVAFDGLPGGAPTGWGSVPAAVGKGAAAILAAADHGDIGVLILLGADPISDFPDRALAMRALEGASTIISLDLFATASSRRADVLLPAAGFAEVSGTTTNLEGRVLPLQQKVNAPGTARADWMIASELALLLGSDLGFSSHEGIFDEFARISRPHQGITSAAVHDPRNAEGLLTDLSASDLSRSGAQPAVTATPSSRHPDAAASALRLVVVRRMYDAATMTMKSPAIADLAGTATADFPQEDFDQLGIAVGATVRLTVADGASTASSITVVAQPVQGVTRGTVVVAANLRGAEVNALLRVDRPVTDVRVDKI